MQRMVSACMGCNIYLKRIQLNIIKEFEIGEPVWECIKSSSKVMNFKSI